MYEEKILYTLIGTLKRNTICEFNGEIFKNLKMVQSILFLYSFKQLNSNVFYFLASSN